MLSSLSIRNVALIEQCDLHFSAGLCVLTGETGAGKSILLDALGLVLGRRADSGLVRHGEKQASVSAEFDVAGHGDITEFLEELGFDVLDMLNIRRVVTAQGKGRCFVNDQPASVSTLKTLGEKLVEVHGQHDNQSLMQAKQHRELLDIYGDLSQEAHLVSKAYHSWKDAEKALKELEASLEMQRKQQEYLEHTVEELAALAPEAGEEEALANERSRMQQAEKHAQRLIDAQRMVDGDDAVEMQLGQLQKFLLRGQGHDGPDIEPALDAIEMAMIQLQHAQQHLQGLVDGYEYDPQQLDHTEERLFALKAAGRKYQVPCDELAELLEKTQSALSQLSSQEQDSAALRVRIEQARGEFDVQADALSVARQHAAERLKQAVMAELGPLKMEKTRFEVRTKSLEEHEWNAHGKDTISFEAATNSGSPLQPIQAIASGGELSRFMLALKVVLSGTRATPSMIFDEIDTGTGGAVADAIGARLGALSEQTQVLVVTHLPQVAARGAQHLFIAKEEREGNTFTAVSELDAKARREEIARMLSAAEVTDEARAVADQLIQKAG